MTTENAVERLERIIGLLKETEKYVDVLNGELLELLEEGKLSDENTSVRLLKDFYLELPVYSMFDDAVENSRDIIQDLKSGELKIIQKV